MNKKSKLERGLQRLGQFFAKGQPLEKIYPLYEALDGFLLTTKKNTEVSPHVRDAIDLKRVMVFVILAVLPCFFFGIYNTGYQIQLALGQGPSFLGCWVLGLSKVLPILFVAYVVGGFWEVLFAVVRGHEINEGFLVTGMLFVLILPPTIPLWQVAAGISFGVVIGKEVFGGTGYNIFNPALVGRAFLFFSYPSKMVGDNIWTAVDGFSQATPLAIISSAEEGLSAVSVLSEAGYSFSGMFFGFIPGSIGETSFLACLAGLVFLGITRIANIRIVAGCFFGLIFSSLIVFCSSFNPQEMVMRTLPPHWHLVAGGFAFGSIFMATDPVSSCATNTGRWIYGFCIGFLVVLIRVFNPAYPEGMMLAILFMNIFSPLIDYVVVESHIRKRNRWKKEISLK